MIRRRAYLTRWIAILTGVALIFSVSACSEVMPDTVVPGTSVAVAWGDKLTSSNAGANPTSGNLDIAAVTRGSFGEVIDGEFVPDETFGEVKIISKNPFVVRFDLKEPVWSDGIPLDAADLLLGWAAATGAFSREGQVSFPKEPAVTAVDEFARSIDITFPGATSEWQQAVPVSVPAHVVGRLAFDTEDEMAAKQAVITAITDRDTAALGKIAKAWRTGFTISDTGTSVAPLLSSGPFRVDNVRTTTHGQTVELIPNARYRGAATPKVSRVELLPAGEDPISSMGDPFDVLQFAPLVMNASITDRLERRDVAKTITHDGSLWGIHLHTRGVFASTPARAAFLRSVPVQDVIQGGARDWSPAYTATTSFTAAPDARAYDVVAQDAGSLGSSGSDAAVERKNAGVADGTPVCVLYDRASEFASGVYQALRISAAETGWGITDCGSDDFDTALADGQGDAVIARTDIAQTVTQLTDQWGSGGKDAISDPTDTRRDGLIADLAATTDVYEAREIRAHIESTIVQEAIALPLAVNPRITLADKTVSGVAPRSGNVAPLTYGMAQWESVK